MDQTQNMDIKRLPEDFLPEGATLEQRWKALRLNVQAWYERCAIANKHNDIGRAGDLQWTYKQVTIPSEESLQDDQQIDDVLAWYRERSRSSCANGAIFWYLHQTPPSTLGPRLFARGVGPNWKPLWMWCELACLPKTAKVNTEFEVQVASDDHSSVKEDEIMEALYRIQPRRVWHLLLLNRVTVALAAVRLT